MRTLTEEVMDTVRGWIASGELQVGEWYSVYQLSDRLGKSRAPVRDGLLRLEEAGLIKFARNRGFQVVETTPSDVAEIFALRLGIEPAAAFRAARHRTDEQLAAAVDLVRKMGALVTRGRKADEVKRAKFEDGFFTLDKQLHSLILQMGRAERGRVQIDKLRAHTRILGHSTAGRSRSLDDILSEHKPILEAIEHGDPESARDAMRAHLVRTGKLLLRQALQAERLAAITSGALLEDSAASNPETPAEGDPAREPRAVLEWAASDDEWVDAEVERIWKAYTDGS